MAPSGPTRPLFSVAKLLEPVLSSGGQTPVLQIVTAAGSVFFDLCNELISIGGL